MPIFTWIECTVKRKLAGARVTETTLGTIMLEIQPVSGLAMRMPFGMIPAGTFALFTRDGDLPKFTLGEEEAAVDYTLEEGDIIYPVGYDQTPPTTFPRMVIKEVTPIERCHFEIIAEGVRNR